MNSENNSTRQNAKFNIYSNSVQINMGVHDIVLQINQEKPGESIEYGTITMSPQHFKVMTQMFMDYVSQYEDIFGRIPMPPSEDKVKTLAEKGVIKFEEPRNK